MKGLIISNIIRIATICPLLIYLDKCGVPFKGRLLVCGVAITWAVSTVFQV